MAIDWLKAAMYFFTFSPKFRAVLDRDPIRNVIFDTFDKTGSSDFSVPHEPPPQHPSCSRDLKLFDIKPVLTVSNTT